MRAGQSIRYRKKDHRGVLGPWKEAAVVRTWEYDGEAIIVLNDGASVIPGLGDLVQEREGGHTQHGLHCFGIENKVCTCGHERSYHNLCGICGCHGFDADEEREGESNAGV